MEAATPTPAPEKSVPATTPVLRTLVLADLVESTALTEQLGDVRAIEIFRKHDRMARDLVARHGGREIDKTDGFLVLFDRPIRAIAFALDYQRALRALGRGEGVPLSARVGIHVGDVLVWENSATDVSQGAKPIEVEGLVKPIAARLMGLARPGQVLMTGVAHTLAQRGRDELGERAADVRFKYHGRYEFKGVAEALPVYEAGEDGVAPLKRPPSGAKAWRETPLWRRPKALLVEGAFVALATALGFWFFGHPEPAIAFAARDWVVVGDLRNLTAEKNFDAALDTALRVSLEQSRFVNLVSDLQVRDALGRMTKPAGTPVDRATGSEIALREGARALIIPTVAEVGGRIRVSAEVVDPHTQATVYAQSADGDGAGSALDSVDKISRRLRNQLGEALQSIDSDAEPLPKVTTANLDALRAYALGWRANIEGRYADAQALYAQATELDPGFALAYLGRARVHFAGNDRATAYGYLQEALARRERLPPRDRLYLDAWLANFATPEQSIARWRLVGTVYPDTFWAHSNVALFLSHFTVRYREALAAVEPATSPHNPYRRSAYYLKGLLQVGLDDRDAALASFRTARELGVGGSLLGYADALAVGRDFAGGDAIMAQSASTGLAGNDIVDRLWPITTAVDRGNWDAAATLAAAARIDARAVNALSARSFDEIELSLGAVRSADAFGARLDAAIAAETAVLADAKDLEHAHAGFALGLLGYVAARAGLPHEAQRALDAAGPAVPALEFPNATAMLAVGRAELLRLRGEPARALDLLDPLDADAAIYQSRVARAAAMRDIGRDEDALREAMWAATHRGAAYAEKTGDYVVRLLNVADSNLALLTAAELAAKLGRHDEARAHRDAFLAAWPQARGLAFIAPRLAALDRAIGSR